MNRPAARVTDEVAHPSKYVLTGNGSQNVVIENLPAWRGITDIHRCPRHGAGAVLKGSTNVLINGFPATRMGDKIIEGGGRINTIIKGATTVVIGG